MFKLLRQWRARGREDVGAGDRLQPHRDVLSTEQDGVTILLDLRREVYLDTADVGSVVWQAIERGATLGEIEEEVTRHYDVPADVVRADIDYFIRDLLRRRLVVRA
jgi:hypothetical protein